MTIDMSLMSNVSISNDRSTVTVGSGARWLKVYEYLDDMGLSVAGGRNADVGVGGLLLGGTDLHRLFPRKLTLIRWIVVLLSAEGFRL